MLIVLLAASTATWPLRSQMRGIPALDAGPAWRSSLVLERAVADGRIVLGSRPYGGLYALDSFTGDVLWTFLQPHASVSSVAVTDPSLVLLQSFGSTPRGQGKVLPNEAILLDARTGDEIARQGYSDTLIGLTGSNALATYTEERLTFTPMIGSGSTSWPAPARCEIENGATAARGIAILVKCSDRDELIFLNSTTLTPNWIRNLPKSQFNGVTFQGGHLLVDASSTILVLDEENRIVFDGSGVYATLASTGKNLTLAVQDPSGATIIQALDRRPGRAPRWTLSFNSRVAVYQSGDSVWALRRDIDIDVIEVTRIDARDGTIRSSHLVNVTRANPVRGSTSLLTWTRLRQEYVGNIAHVASLDEQTGSPGSRPTDACAVVDAAGPAVRMFHRQAVPSGRSLVTSAGTACVIGRNANDASPLVLSVLWESDTVDHARTVFEWTVMLPRARPLAGSYMVVPDGFGVCEIGIVQRRTTLFKVISCAESHMLEHVLQAVAA